MYVAGEACRMLGDGERTELECEEAETGCWNVPAAAPGMLVLFPLPPLPPLSTLYPPQLLLVLVLLWLRWRCDAAWALDPRPIPEPSLLPCLSASPANSFT